MNKDTKQTRIFAAVMIAGGVVLIAALSALGTTKSTRTMALILWLLAVAAVYTVVRMGAARRSIARMQEANRLFTEAHDTDAYIAALQELLKTEEGFQVRQVLHINLTVAYCDKRDYEKALSALQSLPDPAKLNTANAAFYWVNLALCSFYLGKDAEGMAILKEQEKRFAQLRAAGQMGLALAFLEIFELLCQGDREGAAALLENARGAWENEKTAPDFAFMAQKCDVELQPETEENGEEA